MIFMRVRMLLATWAAGLLWLGALGSENAPGAEPPAKSGSWAYTGPRKQKPPAVRDQAAVLNPIDAFVLAKLEAQGLSLSKRADKLTLLRRVTIDLTGLPPTLAEQEAFVADQSPEAYRKVVDRLLASPRYG